MGDDFQPVETMDLVGGEPCLDFVNTASGRSAEDGLHERLERHADLVTWAERVGVADAAAAERMRAEAERRPDAAAAALEQARGLREALYRLFAAVAAGGAPVAADVAALEEAHRASQARRRLAVGPRGVEWRWVDEGDPLDWVVGPVAVSAVDLLLSDRLERVKECTNDACNWLFVDASRNRSRRWCDMRECGNREKARRHYARRTGRAGRG